MSVNRTKSTETPAACDAALELNAYSGILTMDGLRRTGYSVESWALFIPIKVAYIGAYVACTIETSGD